jgi:hypothetical protein
MYDEMQISMPPGMTSFLVGLALLLGRNPWLLTGGLFAVSGLYFSYAAKRKSRLALFHLLSVPITVIMVFVTVVSLFLPLVGTMEKIGK